jgi:DNA repair exonuclease SbcCD ATPase subunit
MRKITYKTLKVQNFLSIGNDTVTLEFQDGLNLITGKNIDNPERKNAVGKSVLIDAYYYALFGTTIRNINKEFVVNNVTKGKGRIELLFDVQTDTETSSYKIVRQIKPSTAELFKLGSKEEDISKDSIANTNKYICELIGSNSIISKSCDILSLSDNVPFMAKKPEEKRKFIEDIFALEIFGKMLKDLKDLIKDNKSDKSISSTKCDEIKNSITTLRNQFETHKKQIEEREENLKRRKCEIEKNIRETKDKMDSLKFVENFDLDTELSRFKAGLDTIDTRIGDCNIAISHAQINIEATQSKIKQFNSIDFGHKCSKCLQDIPENADHIQEELEQCKNILVLYTSGYDAWCEELTKNKGIKDRLKVKISQLENSIFENNFNRQKHDTLYQSVRLYEKNLEDLKSDLKDSSEGLDNFEELIVQTEERLEIETINYNELIQKSEDLETCKFILGEEGIKSFIIKRLLDMLNASVQKYITELGMTMRCKFDEYFDEQITNDKGKSISYWNFSGGERMTIDIACAWAFKDIKRKISGVSNNVEFLDEFMDKSLDVVGLERLIEVLKERISKNNMSVYTISHRVETLKHIDSETVMLEKENGVTRRIIS